MPQYTVQFAIIREVTVESHSDIQAERDAYEALKHYDKHNVVALKVLEEVDQGGALDGDAYKAWEFAKKAFVTAHVDVMTAGPLDQR